MYVLSKIQVRNFTDFNNWPPFCPPPFFYLETMVSLERNNNVNLTFLRMFFIPRPYCLWGMQKLVQLPKSHIFAYIFRAYNDEDVLCFMPIRVLFLQGGKTSFPAMFFKFLYFCKVDFILKMQRSAHSKLCISWKWSIW